MSRDKKQKDFKKAQLQARNSKLHQKIKMNEDLKLDEKCEDVSFEEGLKIAHELKEVLCSTEGGVGMAANQIGIYKNVVITRTDLTSKNVKYFINPKVTGQLSEVNSDIECCLSYPGYSRLVIRPNAVTVKYINIEGKEVEETFFGFDARILLHEIDLINNRCDVAISFYNKKNEKIYSQQTVIEKVNKTFIKN